MIVLISYVFALLIIIIVLFIGYWIIKKKRKKNLGIIFLSAFSIIFLSIAFGDKLFTKKKAKDLLNENGISLVDEFKILKNESSSMDEYYHIFELEISNSDKLRIVNEIKNSNGFQDSVNEGFDLSEYMYGIKSSKFIANFKVSDGFMRQTYKTLGERSYVRDIIKIDTINNVLFYNRFMD